MLFINELVIPDIVASKAATQVDMIMLANCISEERHEEHQKRCLILQD